MIRYAIQKLLSGEPLLPQERQDVIELFDRLEVMRGIEGVQALDEITYNAGQIYDGEFISSANPNNNNFTGTYMNPSGVVGKNNGNVEFQLSSTDGKATAGGGNVRLDSDGVVIALDTADDSTPNRVKWERSLSGAPVGLIYTNVSQVSGNDTVTLVTSAQGDTVTSRGRVLLKASDRLLQKNPTLEIFSDGGTGTVTITADTITFTGTPAGQIAPIGYTPTLTNTTNISSSTAQALQGMRIGNFVTINGAVSAPPTATGQCVLSMSIPIASTFTAQGQLGGTGTTSSYWPVYIRASTSAYNAVFVWNATSTTAQTIYFNFGYKIV